jgi:hypothetical protein
VTIDGVEIDRSIFASRQPPARNKATKKPPPERLPWFDQWRGARGAALRSLVVTIRVALAEHEKTTGDRKRERRPDDQRRYEIAVETVVANLAHSALVNPSNRRLAILTGNKTRGFTRYDNDALGKPFRKLLGGLESLGMVEWQWSIQRGLASSVAPTERLVKMVRDSGVTLEDFGRLANEEVISLSRKRKIGDWRESRIERDWIDYTDTAETNAMRDDMRRVNAWLERASITFVDDGAEPVDVHSRTLGRLFVIHEGDHLTQRFDLSGRLFGGFWQALQRQRREGIRIDGEPAATLDYSSMFARLAYASKGVQLPAGDLYAIPGLEGHRAAVKLGVNALLFDQQTRRQWPKTEEPEQRMPAGWTLARFRRALVECHPVLGDCIGKGLGFELMHTESEIMARVLTTLVSEGVTALPLHDGILVRKSHASMGKEAMEAVSRDMTSYVLPVTCSIAGQASEC